MGCPGEETEPSETHPFLLQGTPKLLRTSECDFVFQWDTPLVCPDEVKADGCALTDEQLFYSFNLSSLSKNIFKVCTCIQPPGSAASLHTRGEGPQRTLLHGSGDQGGLSGQVSLLCYHLNCAPSSQWLWASCLGVTAPIKIQQERVRNRF